jgi:hypothetical protein
MYESVKTDGRVVVNYSCKETAQFIRAELKKNFPGVKFSVVSHVYSGGSSIRVKYNDESVGERDVRAVANFFEGATFDAMTDYKDYKNSFFNGQEVWWGADYVFVDNEAKWNVSREDEDRYNKVMGW